MLELIQTYSDGYWFAKIAIQKGLAAIYLMAFINALNQFPALLGENGLLPLPRFLKNMSFKSKPSLFHWHYSDLFFTIITWLGIILSVLILAGLTDAGPIWLSMLSWFFIWALYLSIVNVGVVFYGFGWESMLLEAGFYAIFLGPYYLAAPVPVIWMYCWMLFRVEFGAGLIKMRGDSCWRDLTCLNYHHETQPLPNPLSRFFHLLPEPVHKFETLANHFVQLVAVWGLFFPQPVASIAAGTIILSQIYLVISGNYSWLNWLTIVLAFSGFGDSTIITLFAWQSPETTHIPQYFMVITLLLAVIVIYLSIDPIRNMISSKQRMNFSFNPIHLVNTYGAFGNVTRKRYEIIIEGTDDNTVNGQTNWKEYAFKGKPGDISRCPPVVSPYHLRLDWQMWFAAMSTHPQRHTWFKPMIVKLLKNDSGILKLLKDNPFPENPPEYIRARLFRYQYTTRKECRDTGNWWKREYVQEYMPPQSLNE